MKKFIKKILYAVFIVIVFCSIAKNTFELNLADNTSCKIQTDINKSLKNRVFTKINLAEFHHEIINEEKNEEEEFELSSFIRITILKLNHSLFNNNKYSSVKLNTKPIANYLSHYLQLLLTFF